MLFSSFFLVCSKDQHKRKAQALGGFIPDPCRKSMPSTKARYTRHDTTDAKYGLGKAESEPPSADDSLFASRDRVADGQESRVKSQDGLGACTVCSKRSRRSINGRTSTSVDSRDNHLHQSNTVRFLRREKKTVLFSLPTHSLHGCFAETITISIL